MRRDAEVKTRAPPTPSDQRGIPRTFKFACEIYVYVSHLIDFSVSFQPYINHRLFSGGVIHTNDAEADTAFSFFAVPDVERVAHLSPSEAESSCNNAHHNEQAEIFRKQIEH